WQRPAVGAAHWANLVGARAAAWTSFGSSIGPILVAKLTEPRPNYPPLANQGFGPPAPLYLAVRACRNAAQASPDYPGTYLTQAQAYTMLYQFVEAQWAGGAGGRVANLRQLQQVTALERILALRPNLAEIHLALVNLYQSMNFLDYALLHLNETLKLTRAAGKLPGEPQADFTKRLEQLQEDV